MALAALAVVAVAGLAQGPASSATVADPRAGQERIEKEVAEAAAILEHATERAQEAATRYVAADAALPEAEARLDRARGEVAAAFVRADSAESAADLAAAELTVASDQVDDSAAEMDRARDDAATFAIAAYKGSRLSGVNVLLQAGGPDEAVQRLGYLEQVAGAERAAIDGLAAARLYARQAENDATVAVDQAESTRLAAEAALAATGLAEAEAEAASGEAEALAQTRAEALEVAEAERDASLRRYAEVEAEAEEIEARLAEWEAIQREKLKARERAEQQARELGEQQPDQQPEPPAQRAHQPAPLPGTVGQPATGFVQPTQGWESSPYGLRFDPFFGVWQMHAGVDIAADGGTPIYAVEDGTVISAGWNGGYGNYTCLGHGTHRGQGLSTCYAHQSEILVASGQSVRRGEEIGRVGTTGASTGNHLHFEVRLDGSPTDPIPFLP